MATFNTTGGKYAIRTLSAVGTTTVTIATGTFVSGDFGTTQRIVALYDSANVFKGIAWVRRFVSTTQLELENRFVDPVTGLFATQTTTDQILVSKVPSEVVVAGITYDAVTRSSSLTSGWEIGTFGSQTSACIYAENTKFAMTDGIMVSGGVVVFGKLLSYDGVSKESFVWNRECSLEPLSTFSAAGAGSYNYSVLRPNGAGGNFFMFGGNVGGSYQSSNFMGIVGGGTGGRSFAFYGTRQNYGCTSPSNGTTWGTNAARHLLYKCSFEATFGNANLIMWGDGTWEGGNIAFPQYVAGPLGAFRANGTSAYAAGSGVRALVSDLGQGALIDGISSSTYNFTNLITPAVNSVRTGSSGASTINANFYYQDDYTNLKPNTTVVVRRTVDSVLATSVVNTASTSFTARVLQRSFTATTTGNMTPVNTYSSFDYTIKCYGYDVVSGNHSTYTYNLGTGGSGTDLKLGGLINQLTDAGVTLTETNALLLSSKISINSTTKVITITANVTYDELYDYVVAWNCSSAANAVIPTLSQYLLTKSGSNLTAYTGWSLVVNTGVTLASGTKFTSLYVPTITLNGTGAITAVYATTAGTSSVLAINVPSDGYSVCLYRNGTTKYFGSNLATGTYNVYLSPAEANTYTIAAENYGEKRTEDTLVLTGGSFIFNITDLEDVGITASKATATAYTTLATTEEVYDATAIFRLTETGIKLGQLVARDGLYLDFGTYNVKFKDDASAIVGVATGTITYKSIVINEATKYNAMKATPPATITATDTEQINVLIEDANGDSQLSVLGGDNLGYELWKITTSTATDDYATGTLLDTLSTNTEVFRFIGISGYDIVGRDVSSGVRRRSSMVKGSYEQAFYVGNQIQLATDAPQLIENNEKLDELILKIDTQKDPLTLPQFIALK